MAKDATILIADDSAFMRKILRDILEGDGFTNITECEDGKQCLDTYNEKNPDLVLVDMIMPVMDGMTFIKESNGAAKVIVVSAVGQESMMEEAKGLGVIGYITKPFEKNLVIETVNKALGE
jgi:two-component system, chemotaxis family, chemotaxis protein CheY